LTLMKCAWRSLMATVPYCFEKKAAVPPLCQGDHLTADEFLRRYEAMPEANKAELIEGKVYMPSPVPWDDHGDPHFDLIWWLGADALVRGDISRLAEVLQHGIASPEHSKFVDKLKKNQRRKK